MRTATPRRRPTINDQPTLTERLRLEPTNCRQRGKAGVKLTMDPDLPSIIIRPYLDTLKIDVPALSNESAHATRNRLWAKLGTSVRVFVRKPAPDAPNRWGIILQDATPSVVQALPEALASVGFDPKAARVFELHVALDAFLARHEGQERDDATRSRWLDALVRHLYIAPERTLGRAGMRWVGWACRRDGKRADKVTVFARRRKFDLFTHRTAPFNVLDPDATVYIGRRKAPTMYRIMHKRTDRRFRDQAAPLGNERRRVRIEAELRRDDLASYGFGTLNDLRDARKIERLRKLFIFASPVITDREAVGADLQPLLDHAQATDLGAFQACGLWGVLDRRHFLRRHAPKRRRVDGRRVSTDARRALRIVRWSKFNGRVLTAFKRFGRSYAVR